jgi:HAE1 family hydrophobic/amphiphilic exporter-1
VVLVPASERSRSSEEVAAAIGPLIQPAVPGMRISARPGGGLFIFNFIRGGDSRVRVDVRGHDLDTADRLAAEVSAIVSTVEGVTDSRVSRQPGGRELQVRVDRERASDLGVTTREVAEAVSTLVQGSRAGVLREDGDEYYIRVRMPEERLASIGSVLEAPFVLRDGRTVRLRELVTVDDGSTPRAIERYDQERIVTVSGGIEAGRDLGSINEEIRVRLRDINVPDGFALIIAGEGEQQDQSFASLNIGIALAVLLVFMVMAAQFESLLQPVLVMASIPFAGIGVVLVLVLTGTTLNLNSFMGIIVLVGIVVNNAIVLVDAANQLRLSGMPVRDAAIEAARRRLRPILMTTSTTMLGLLPVALGLGTGAEAQAPLARVIVGGLGSSTLVTLIVIPVLYAVVVGFLERGRRAPDATR